MTTATKNSGRQGDGSSVLAFAPRQRNRPLVFLKTRNAGLILIALYLVLGLFIFKDYGMSFDESYSREDSLVAYNYMVGLENSKSEAVREFAKTIPDFDVYPEKHGTALHIPLVAIEHIYNFELPTRTVYLMRHIFLFLNYILAACFFYAILRRRFPDSYAPFIGVLLFILYPRFFAEAFYNNKDILFYCWYVISSYAVLRWLEKPTIPKTLLAGAALALATNTRILALSILLLALAFYIARALLEKKGALAAIAKAALLIAAFLVAYTAVSPLTWKNPIIGIAEIFEFFIRFNLWDGQQLYLGEWIGKAVPWHYIPVWMGVTSPILYIALFVAGTSAFVLALARNKAKLRFLLCDNMYDSFFAALFWFTLLGFIGFGIYVYNGWRHAYSIFCSFLYISVYGLDAASGFIRQRHKLVRYAATAAVAASMIATTVWIATHHPYQYVYFNSIAAPYARENFDRDYWAVSGNASLDHLLEIEPGEHITFAPPHPSTWYMLSERDKERVLWQENPFSWADFNFFPDTRAEHPYSPDYAAPYIHGNILPEIPGYELVHDVVSGGITLNRLYRNMALDAFDDEVINNIRIVRGTQGNGDFGAMFDSSPDTYWTTGAPQKAGDYLQVEFIDPVRYNFVRLEVGQFMFDYAMGPVLVSSDGEKWSEAEVVWRNAVDYLIEAPPYRYLRFVIEDPGEENWWSVTRMRFGNVDPEWYG